MRLAVYGAGYVGLTFAACLAAAGRRVHIVDTDARKIAALQAGRIPVQEPGLAAKIEDAVNEGRLTFSAQTPDHLHAMDAVVIATPTGEVETTAREVAPRMAEHALLVLKSTTDVGTAASLAAAFHNVHVISNPEFLRQGQAIQDCCAPFRMLVGSDDADAAARFRTMLSPMLADGFDDWHTVSRTEAELTKLAANAMLAHRVAFADELSGICDAWGADVDAVVSGLGMDPRVGFAHLRSSLGFGGGCLPKDLRAWVALGESGSPSVRLGQAVDGANRARRRWAVDAVESFAGGLAGRRVAQWGLAFKEGTDDLRESPALALARGLLERGAELRVFDPLAEWPDDVSSCMQTATPLAACDGADVVVVAVASPQVRALEPGALHAVCPGASVVDFTRCVPRESLSGLSRVWRVGAGELYESALDFPRYRGVSNGTILEEDELSNRRYTDEFRAEAVRQVLERGFSVKEVASNLGVSMHSLYKWVRVARPGPERRRESELLESKREVLRLQAQLRRTEEERDILKKAAAYFARESE